MRILPVINLLLIVGIAIFIYLQETRSRTVYVLNHELFANFKGTKELESKLKAMRDKNRRSLDSLILVGQKNLNNPQVLQQVTEQQQTLQLTERQISDQYTVDIWKRINVVMKQFGKEKGYSFVFGATGDGTIMYAKDATNVTTEAIEYVNAKYDSGEY